jgi:plasmid maintenance system antidote protein VapI
MVCEFIESQWLDDLPNMFDKGELAHFLAKVIGTSEPEQVWLAIFQAARLWSRRRRERFAVRRDDSPSE